MPVVHTRCVGDPETAASASVAVVAATVAAVAFAHPSGNLRKRGIGKASGIDPRTKASDLSRVLVSVDEGLAVIRWLGMAVAALVVEAGRELQGRSAFVVEVGNVVSKAARAVLVLALGPVIR